MNKRIAALTIVAVLAAIGLAFSVMPRERTYTGVYTLAMEHQGFRADGNDEEWWVSGDLAGSINMTVAKTLPNGSRIFEGRGRVTLRGIVSSKGRHGHLGMWAREIEVTEVVSVAPTN
ncbi:MAG: hypothetical protein ACYTFI_02410 [Planctomycetota bacterium]|jgi:hypothetical protein